MAAERPLRRVAREDQALRAEVQGLKNRLVVVEKELKRIQSQRGVAS